MGQYHVIYNLDKREKIEPMGMNCFNKAVEQVGFPKSPSTALFALLMNSNGRGGGDFQEHPMVGRWAGDRIVVQGDYAETSDPCFIEDEQAAAYLDISPYVRKMLDECFDWLEEEEEEYNFSMYTAALAETEGFSTPEEKEEAGREH